MNAPLPRRRDPAARIILRLGLVILLLLAALGFIVWRAPIWVAEKLSELRLSRAGIDGHTMTVDGLEIHYMEGGTGPPVVLIHGLGSQAQNDWSGLAPALVHAGYHIYAMDLPGYGHSAKPSDRTYSIPEQAKFVESFISANHPGAVTLAGVSMGGWVASTVALEQPQAVARLVLIDSAGMAFHLSFDRELFTPRTREQVDQLIALVTPGPPRMPGFVKDAFIRKAQRNGWVVRRALDSMIAGADDLDQRFPSLKMPMLLVWGKQDAITSLRLGESMHHAAPQSVLAIYDGCGHIAVVSCNDRIAPTVVDFLAGNGPRPGQTIEIPAK